MISTVVSRILFESGSYCRVGCGIDCGRRIVHNHDFRLFEQSARDAKTLFLTAGYVDAALTEFGFVTVGERHNEVVRLRRFCSVFDFLVRCVFVAPKQVLPYRAAEQHVLLKHHCDGISEFVKLVVLDVDAPDLHLAVQNVVKSGNQLDESGLCRAGSAYDTDGFTAPDMQVDVFKIEDVAGFRIGKSTLSKSILPSLTSISCESGASSMSIFRREFQRYDRGTHAKARCS